MLVAVALLLKTSAVQAEPLPDGERTRLGTLTAYLIEPTRRYAHGALGDMIEAGGFAVERDGAMRRFLLPETEVFEDLRVRLHDLDGDGEPEAILIRSHVDQGASIAVYDLSLPEIRLKAQTPFIGRRHRWLNIAGIADFTGNGAVQIAAVVTPHLAGSLRIFDLNGPELLERARIDGYTNHVNGSRDLDLAEILDQNGDSVADIKLPRIDGSGMAVVTFAGGRTRELAAPP